jgi:hypothetical protein
MDRLPTKILRVWACPAVVAGWMGGEAIGLAIKGGEDKLGGGGPDGWVCVVGVMLVKAMKSSLTSSE